MNRSKILKSILIALILILLFLPTACVKRAPVEVTGAFPQASLIEEASTSLPGIISVWRAYGVDGKLLGCCAYAESQGYKGPIKIFVSWEPDLGITRLEIIEHNESPDYGGKYISQAWFTQQFVGNSSLHPFNLVKMRRIEPEDVVIITGATITSSAVTNGVNNCLEVFRQAMEEGSK